MINCCIFDLDGVIVDTAKYHYLAWKKLADELGLAFDEKDNEKLKGVSRVESLTIILDLRGASLSPAAFENALSRKNAWYLEYIERLTASEILPGVTDLVNQMRDHDIKTAVGSASKNAMMILENLDLISSFDTVVDGNRVSKAKPDPEVFLTAASELDVDPRTCLVFEDAAAGVDAALNAGMRVVGLGAFENLGHATTVMPNLEGVTLEKIMAKI